MAKRRKTSDAVDIMNRRYGNSTRRRAAIDRIKTDMAVGRVIHDARVTAGLTQQQLAKRIGTTQSVVSQLESADYEGHSMPMLRRVAKALRMRVEVRLIKDAA